jgi:hypothetical protein
MNTKRLEGPLLDFWVAKAAGLELDPVVPSPADRHDPSGNLWHPDNFHPSTNWTHGARFFNNEWFNIEDCMEGWFGPDWSNVPVVKQEPLAWFMRAYVTVMFSETLEEV